MKVASGPYRQAAACGTLYIAHDLGVLAIVSFVLYFVNMHSSAPGLRVPQYVPYSVFRLPTVESGLEARKKWHFGRELERGCGSNSGYD